MAGKKKVVVQPEAEAQEELAVQMEQPAQQEEAAQPAQEAQPVEVQAAQPAQQEEAAQPAQQEEAAQPAQEAKPKKSAGSKFAAGCKEWFRKRIVALKRSPQSIVLYALFICAALWLIWLFTFSRTIDRLWAAEWCGLVVFVNTLISILVIALFGSAFPKRKKPNIVFLVLLFVFMAAIIACDVIYFVKMGSYVKNGANLSSADLAAAPYIQQSLGYAIAHAVLIGITAVLLATLPLYKKLINMINTRKDVESNEMNEVIDVEED